MRPKVQSIGLLTGWRISSEETTACNQKAAMVSEVNALLFELRDILKIQTFSEITILVIFFCFPKL